jgi:hypothetical protein
MQYLKNVMESEGVQTLVNENDKLINDTIDSTISSIIEANINIAKDNLDSFVVEGDLLDTYEDISIWANEDLQEYMETVSMILSDKELTQEQKLEILQEGRTAYLQGKLGTKSMKDQKGFKNKASFAAGKVMGAGRSASKSIGKKWDAMKKGAGDMVDKTKEMFTKKKPATA